MYYNTLKKKDATKEIKRTASQDKLILILITKYKEKTLTPRIVWKLYQWEYEQAIFLTSIRRSINTLIKLDLVEYTGDKCYHLCSIDNIWTTEYIIKLKEDEASTK